MKSDIFEKYHIFWSKNAFLAKYKRRKLLLVSTLHISRRYLHSFASIHMNSTCTYVYWARVDCNHFRSKLLSIIYSLFAKSATCLQTDQTREKKKESTKITYTHNSTTHFLLILLSITSSPEPKPCPHDFASSRYFTRPGSPGPFSQPRRKNFVIPERQTFLK